MITLKEIIIVVASATATTAVGYVALIGLILATAMQNLAEVWDLCAKYGIQVQQHIYIYIKGYLMKITTNKEFLTAYEKLLAKLGECKDRHELAIVTREVQMFEMEYPEFVDEYYYEKEYEYNEQTLTGLFVFFLCRTLLSGSTYFFSFIC